MTPKGPCEEWKVALSAYLDGEGPTACVVEHLRECESCRRWVADVEWDERLVRETLSVDGQPKFVDDVMAEVRRIAAAEPLPGPAAWLPRRFRWAEMAALAAVAALLIAIVAPLFMGVRANAAKTLCLNNARLVAYATRVYANDHWDHMPSGDRWDRSLRPYVHSELVFYCPAPDGMLYGFPAELSGESLQAMVYPSATLTLFDQGPRPGDFAPRHHGVGSVAFLDGHVTALPSLPDLPGISRPAGPASSAAHGRSAGPPE